MKPVKFFIDGHWYVLAGSWVDPENVNIRAWCDEFMAEISRQLEAGIHFAPLGSLPDGFVSGKWFLDGVSPADAVAKFAADMRVQSMAVPA